MSKSTLKRLLALLVVVSTIVAFAIYLRNNPDTVKQLQTVPLGTIGFLLLLYGVFLGTLIWIQRATLSLCHITLGRKESSLLIMYSSIINFFGPLQSGPAFRAAYLKKRHNINLKHYALATLLYYGFYALFSGLFLLTYFYGLVGLGGIVSLVAVALFAVHTWNVVPARFKSLELRHISNLALATFAQVSTFAGIFYVALNSLGSQVTAVPALIYTGAANFALFVSLTPGAIGFRESFVFFAQGLHSISSETIVTASLIDRGVYVLFLGILFVIASSMHAKQYLTARKNPDA